MRKIGRFKLLVEKADGDESYQGDMMEDDDGAIVLCSEVPLSSDGFDDPNILITVEAAPDDYVPPAKTTYTTAWSRWPNPPHVTPGLAARGE